MREDRNQFQIIRKDARNCFVESLNDSFSIGRIHLAFAAYDQSKPAGQRQTNNVHIYIAVDEFLELCRKLDCGELLCRSDRVCASFLYCAVRLLGRVPFPPLFALCRILYCKCFAAVLYFYQGRLYLGKRHLYPGGNDCDTKARKKPDA